MIEQPADALFSYRELFALSSHDNPGPLTTFLEVLDGVGSATAEHLRGAGVSDWYEVPDSHAGLTRLRRSRLSSDVVKAHQALVDQDVTFFAERLQRREHWRIAAAFPSKTTFLDIETTGLSHYYHQVTVIGWAADGQYNAVIGDPVNAAPLLAQHLRRDTVVVTYNGAHFDLPFLARHIPGFEIPPVHVDLRHLAQRVGLTGGQKKIEQKIGVARPRSIQSFRGEAAPGLWFKYTRGDVDALRDLLEYNHADVDGLRQLLDHIVTKLHSKTTHSWKASEFGAWLAANQKEGAEGQLRPFAGRSGPRITASDLRFPPGLKVVGIDLTGSAKRATGWAAVEGVTAVTLRINEDDEILAKTLAFGPDIVSIDAPLSLPRGRTQVDDSDPGRFEFGIAREAERELWRRGVKTYPALIQSMQQLTARGIRLAGALRQEGVPVIESFPGAMQDILGMPRKGLSLSELKHSLIQYGLEGAFTSTEISHDELDALSSAIVAHFFLDGRYEALGDEHEEPMIVPALDANQDDKPVVVAIAGPIASGKSTLAAVLEGRGFARVRFSEVLLREFPNDSDLDDREHLRLIGEQINRDGRQRWLARKVLNDVAGATKIVIDGVRYPEDYAVLFEENPSRLQLIFLTISENVRKYRYGLDRERTRSISAMDKDRSEKHRNFLQERATHTYDNSGSIQDLTEFAANLSQEVEQCLLQS